MPNGISQINIAGLSVQELRDAYANQEIKYLRECKQGLETLVVMLSAENRSLWKELDKYKEKENARKAGTLTSEARNCIDLIITEPAKKCKTGGDSA